MPGISAVKTGIPFSKKGFNFSSYWATRNALYGAVYNTFVTKPTQREAEFQCTLIEDIASVIPKLKVLQLYGSHTNDNGESLINLLAPGTMDATLHGSALPAFSKYVGFAGNSAASAYIDTHFNPSENADKFQLNDACFGVYLPSATPDAGRIGAGGAGQCILIPNHDGGTRGAINQDVAAVHFTNLIPEQQKEVFIINRPNATDVDIWINGLLSLHGSAASTALINKNIWCLGVNYNNGVNFMDRPIGAFFAGASLTESEIRIISAALQKYFYYITKSYGNHIPLAPFPLTVTNTPFELCDGKLYTVISGETNSKRTYAYDLTLKHWQRKADCIYPTAYAQGAAMRSVNGKLYFIGGTHSGIGALSGVYEYDPVTDGWTTKTPMPTPREDFGTAVVGTKIYCMGGLGDGGSYKKLEIYDTATDTWDTSKADMPDLKLLGDFGASVDGKVYAISGSNVTYGPGLQEVHPVTTVYRYDPDIDEWETLAPVPLGTVYSESGVIGNYIYRIGGCPEGLSDDLSIYIKDAYRYDTVNNIWAKVTDSPNALLGSTLAEYNNKLYYLGGGRNSTRTSDTREFYLLSY